MLSFTGLVEAGLIKEQDNKLMFIQGLSLEAATAVAEWLAVATGESVCLRHIEAMRGDTLIRRHPNDVNWKQLPEFGR